MLEKIKQKFIHYALPPEVLERIEKAPLNLNSAGVDPWGLDPEAIKVVASLVHWLYTQYFRVQATGGENIPAGRALIVANHGGQLPIDGLLISLALLLEANPPRIPRSMVERFVPTLPFVSHLLPQYGAVIGNPQNCKELLDKDEAVLVFPEGAKGLGKLFQKRYQLQKFGTGFVRLALATKTPIIPTAIIGCEESLPGITNIKILARILGTPYFPLTSPVPLPTKITIRFGKPILFEGDPEASDLEIEAMVARVKTAIHDEIQIGLKKRGDDIFTKAAL